MKYSQGNTNVGSVSPSRWENGKVLICITQQALKNKAIYDKRCLMHYSLCIITSNPPVKTIMLFPIMCMDKYVPEENKESQESHVMSTHESTPWIKRMHCVEPRGEEFTFSYKKELQQRIICIKI